MKRVKPRSSFRPIETEEIELHPKIEEKVVEEKLNPIQKANFKKIGSASYLVTLVGEIMTAESKDPGTIVGQVHYQASKRFVHVMADSTEEALSIGGAILLPGQKPKTKQSSMWMF